MSRHTVISDRWIVSQLIGIRMLERELAHALDKPSGVGKERLERRLRQLNSWVDAVDQSLSSRPGRRTN